MNIAPAKSNICLLFMKHDSAKRLAYKHSFGTFQDQIYESFEAATGGHGLKLASICQPERVLLDRYRPDMTDTVALTEQADDFNEPRCANQIG